MAANIWHHRSGKTDACKFVKKCITMVGLRFNSTVYHRRILQEFSIYLLLIIDYQYIYAPG